MSKEARQHLQECLEWRQQEEDFVPTADTLMFLCQDSKHRGERLSYKGLYRRRSWVRSLL